jgi:hypothetical protein
MRIDIQDWQTKQAAYGAYVVHMLSLAKPRYLHNFTDIAYYSPTVKTGLFGGFISGIDTSKYLMDYPFCPTNVKYFAEKPNRIIGNISTSIISNSYPIATFEYFIENLWEHWKERIDWLMTGNDKLDSQVKKAFA